MMRLVIMLSLFALAGLSLAACGNEAQDMAEVERTAREFLDTLRAKKYAQAYNMMHPSSTERVSGAEADYAAMWKSQEPFGAADFTYTLDVKPQKRIGGSSVPYTVVALIDYTGETAYAEAQRSGGNLPGGGPVHRVRELIVRRYGDGWAVIAFTIQKPWGDIVRTSVE